MKPDKNLYFVDLDRRKKASLSAQIEHALIKKISSGDIPAGHPLPSYDWLYSFLNVSSKDVELAYQKLMESGFLIIDETRVHRVIQKVIRETSFYSMKSLIQTIENAGLSARFETLFVHKSHLKAHPRLPELFSKTASITHCRRVYFANDIPAFIMDSYIDMDAFGLTTDVLTRDLIYPRLADQHQIILKNAHRLVYVDKPTASISKILNVPIDEPILRFENVFYDQHESLIDFSIVWAAPHYHLEMDYTPKGKTVSID